LSGYFVQKIYANWIEKELYFSMNKLSFLVLVIGLFFLSSLLFVTGFLVAVNIYDIGAPKYSQMPTTTLPTIEVPHVTAPMIALPNAPSVSSVMPSALPTIAPPATPNPNIMKTGTQAQRMADVPMVDTAHMPSIYAQLPVQALPPTPQPMPQSGGHYIQPQQAQVVQHVPTQAPVQQQPMQAAPVQAPVHHQPSPQPYYPPPPQMYPPQPYPYHPPYAGPYSQPQPRA
jgi:hypothetical protein